LQVSLSGLTSPIAVSLDNLVVVTMTPFFVMIPAVLSVGADDLKRYEFSEPHMGTRFGILAYARDESAAKKGAKAAFARVAELNRIMSDYDSTSELMRLCGKAGGEPVKVSDELFFVLARSQKVARESEGAFDVTVGPVVRLWRVARRTTKLPDETRLKKALALVGYKNVELDEKAKTVKLLKKGMQLDLGGIAKGYAADEMLRVLAKHGLSRALVSCGGDLAARDAPPGKDAWTVAIAPVDAKKEGPRYLKLVNAAVSTSGDAEQYIEIDGKRYSHIVDPRTGIGLVGRMSATVIAPDGITADSLTKVVAVLGAKKGFALIEKYKGVSARLVTKTDEKTKVVTTKTFPKLSEGKE
jgi:thiamine biosynthesis lipoprotein